MNGINSLLMRAEARGRADIIYRMRRILLICSQQLLTTQSRSHTEYLIPTDNIIILIL